MTSINKIPMTIEDLKNNNWMDENGNLWNDPDSAEWKEYSGLDVEVKPKVYLLPKWFINSKEDYRVNCKMLKVILQSNKRSLEEYYSRFILNLSEVPICENYGCSNKVHIRDGKISRGVTKCCSRSCHISKRNRELWKDPGYVMNSPEFREKKSREMKNNLDIWNHNPEFQAKSKRGKVLSHKVDYIFYLARTASGYLKFGVTQKGSKDWRIFVQKEWNNDEYVSFHTIFESGSSYMADFEYNLKSRLRFREYLNWNEFKELNSLIRELRSE